MDDPQQRKEASWASHHELGKTTGREGKYTAPYLLRIGTSQCWVNGIAIFYFML